MAGVVALAGSFLVVRSGRSAELDRRAAKALAYPLGRRADVAISAFTDLGSIYGMAGLAGILAVAGRRDLAGKVLVSGSLAWISAQASKPLVGRERPYLATGADRLVAVPAGSSWPSGHVAVATAMGECLTPHLSRRGRGAVHAAVAGVAASRCYVGVHHFTDVVAGWGVGALVAAATRQLWRTAPPLRPSSEAAAVPATHGTAPPLRPSSEAAAAPATHGTAPPLR